MNTPLLMRITHNPDIMTGKPVIRGTRIPVDLIVRMVAQGIEQSEILAEYPRLQAEDIQAALFYAAAVVANETVFPITLKAA
ncbi:MAG: DUF433 domain-containing protein [Caldilineaceae bacterium]|nr:DUF433 domain-containing protein [Caldilineaceae bacterium]